MKSAAVRHPLPAIVALNARTDFWRGEIVPADHATSVKWWREAVAKGHLAAMVDLAFCLRSGDGMEANYKEALELYRKAAEKGNSHGQHGLATMYYHGLGTEKKPNEAIKWWRKAAEQGLTAAQVDLAFTLRQTNMWPEALQWYKKAAEQGNAGGQHGYGCVYSSSCNARSLYQLNALAGPGHAAQRGGGGEVVAGGGQPRERGGAVRPGHGVQIG